MEDQHAHQRIDIVEGRLTRIEMAIEENTSLTKQIADNTAELVTITRGAKVISHTAVWSASWLRKVAIWISPLAVVAGVVYEVYKLGKG
jgi:hypothetical protein